VQLLQTTYCFVQHQQGIAACIDVTCMKPVHPGNYSCYSVHSQVWAYKEDRREPHSQPLA
jgi:hypothetical protein